MRRFARECPVFALVSAGQVLSTLGSSISAFCISFHVLQLSDSIAKYSLASVLMSVPPLLVSPLAGVVADRCNRRRVMVVADFLSMLGTLCLALVPTCGARLRLRHIYAAVLWCSLCGEFQAPAFEASFDQLVPKRHRDRASSLVQLCSSACMLIAPAIAGCMTAMGADLTGVLWLDVSTFVLGSSPLWFVTFPPIETSEDGKEAKAGGWYGELAFGAKYLKRRPELLALLLVLAVDAFIFGFISELVPPLVLTFTTPAVLGYLSSFVGCGMLLGSIAVALVGTPARAVRSVLVCLFLQAGTMMACLQQANCFTIGSAGFVYFFVNPFISHGLHHALRATVPNDIQGKVLALSGCITSATPPLAYALSGPLAEFVFEPLLASTSAPLGQYPLVARVIGTGKGRGLCAIFFLLGLLEMAICAAALLCEPLRQLDVQVATPSDPQKTKHE
eukprot:TRINITY_DN4024_c0_g1_i1.p1 TRINITY_DN4024_c0_g1~~TRINITY_DN4024_c0_g1_i1.p1  ORF type:complete len:448 (+),score=102.95 TRINITY_DN4024_c0_g1_i1:23-1366(+)